MAKLISFLLIISFLQATIIETNRMEDILPHVDGDTWVLFDLDDTLIESELQVGRAKWFFHEVKKLTEEGHEHDEAVILCYPQWIHMQEICPVRPPEPQIPVVVQEVQQTAGAVFGLTARHPPVCPATLKQLAKIGIDFTFTAPPCPKIDSKTPVHWEGGVLFLTDFNKKGLIFRKWLELTLLRPKKVILVDDSKNNLFDMEAEMAKIGMPCTCFHYTKTLERPFDARVAESEYVELIHEAN